MNIAERSKGSILQYYLGFVIMIFVLSILEWPFYTDFTLYPKNLQ